MNFLLNNRALPAIWLMLVLGMCILLLLQWQRAPRLNTDMMDLLPAAEYRGDINHAAKQFSSYWTQQVVLLVGGENEEQSLAAAKSILPVLQDSQLFSEVFFLQSSKAQKDIYQTFYPHRFNLLTNEQREALEVRDYDQLWQQFLRRLYTGALPSSSDQLEQDPLLLFPQWILSLAKDSTGNIYKGALQFKRPTDNAEIANSHSSAYYTLIRARLKGSPFALDVQKNFKTLMQDTQVDQLDVVRTGVIYHAIIGTDSARQEVTFIGGFSLIGILLLVFMTFYSLRPIVLSLIALSVGVLVGVTNCVILFGEIHLFSLVFGASLIGVAIDYAFHYFSDCGDHKAGNIARIFPGITLGLISSIIGYISLSLTGFPGLTQIAVFSASGLFAAWLCVCLWFPLFPKAVKPFSQMLVNGKPYRPWLVRWSAYFTQLWQQRTVLVCLSVLCGIGFVGACITLSNLQFNDHISVLQTISPEQKAEDRSLASITDSQRAVQFILIQGDSPQQVISREESISPVLQGLQQQGILGSYQAISQSLPSIDRQQQHHLLLRTSMSHENELYKKFTSLGFSSEALNDYQQQLQASKFQALTLSRWLQSPIGQQQDFLWIGEIEGAYYSAVLLDHVKDIDTLMQQFDQSEGVYMVDTPGAISNIFQNYRRLAIKLILSAYGVITVLLLLRYWHRGWMSLTILIPPVLSGTAALALVSVLSEALNIFHIFAIIMVVAIGIDYAVFFAEYSAKQQTTMLAISLSAITTVLAFGLLALSNTAAISSFGLTMAIGIALAYFLSPLANMNTTVGKQN